MTRRVDPLLASGDADRGPIDFQDQPRFDLVEFDHCSKVALRERILSAFKISAICMDAERIKC